jgi:hypothetical protein
MTIRVWFEPTSSLPHRSPSRLKVVILLFGTSHVYSEIRIKFLWLLRNLYSLSSFYCNIQTNGQFGLQVKIEILPIDFLLYGHLLKIVRPRTIQRNKNRNSTYSFKFSYTLPYVFTACKSSSSDRWSHHEESLNLSLSLYRTTKLIQQKYKHKIYRYIPKR